MGARTVIPMFVLNFEKFKRKFMYFSVKKQAILVDICMNMCYTMRSTLKEGWKCIGK